MKGPVKKNARLWIGGLTPKVQVAARRRCDFCLANQDPAKAMEVTQQMVLLGVDIPKKSDSKKAEVKSGKFVAEEQTNSAGSSPGQSSPFRGRCDDCGGRGHTWRDCPNPSGKRQGAEEHGGYSDNKNNSVGSGGSRSAGAVKSNVVSATDWSKGPSSSTKMQQGGE